MPWRSHAPLRIFASTAGYCHRFAPPLVLPLGRGSSFTCPCILSVRKVLPGVVIRGLSTSLRKPRDKSWKLGLPMPAGKSTATPFFTKLMRLSTSCEITYNMIRTHCMSATACKSHTATSFATTSSLGFMQTNPTLNSGPPKQLKPSVILRPYPTP